MRSFHELRSLLDKVERHVVYGFLYAFVATQWLAVFVPRLSSHLSPQLNSALFSVLLLAVFRLFDYGGSRESLVTHSKGLLAEAIDGVVETGKSVETVDLLVHTGSKYVSVLRNKRIHIRTLRLLVASDEALMNSVSLSQEERDDLVGEKRRTLRRWEQMRDEGFIESLLIGELESLPYLHFAVFNGKSAVFGLFEPMEKGSGVRMLTVQSAFSAGQPGNDVVCDLQSVFDSSFALARSYSPQPGSPKTESR